MYTEMKGLCKPKVCDLPLKTEQGQTFEYERVGTGVISRTIGSVVVGAQAVVSDALNAAIFRDPRER